MEFKGIQDDVEQRVSQFKDKYFPTDKILRQMVEETGEVARTLSLMDGTKKPKEGETVESLGGELADLMFAVVCMANSNGIDLGEEWQHMMESKRYGRDNNRFEKKT